MARFRFGSSMRHVEGFGFWSTPFVVDVGLERSLLCVYHWGFDIALPRGFLTLTWRPRWGLQASPDGTPNRAWFRLGHTD